MAVSSMTGGVAADTTSAAKPPSAVDLLALITPANSTAQIFAGTTYYGNDYTQPPPDGYGTQEVVPFFQGPAGIADSIVAHKGDPTKTGVVASGWGAGQTGTALAGMSSIDKSNVAFVILDNNTNRAGGGFWTTYAPFAPLLGTSATATPSDLGVPTLDVAYEYNINSDAPVDPLNPFALGNSLAAYAYGYGAQSTAVIPPDIMAEAQSTDPKTKHYAYVIDTKGNIVNDAEGNPMKKEVSGTTTYVTIQQDNLPLTRPLRLIPGGDIVADAIDPTMTDLVNAGYNDGKGVTGSEAIPKDPTVTRPMQPGSSLGALGDVPGSVPIGLAKGGATAQDDLQNPTNLVVKPVGEVGKLPVINGAGLPSLPGLSTTGGNLFAPNSKPAGTAATGGSGLKNFSDKINDAVNKVTGGLTAAKPGASN
jgi:hypothetical protein